MRCAFGLRRRSMIFELTRMISIQTAPQIRLVQNNDTMMVEKIQSTIVNTIPRWKSQMVLALGVEHSTQAAEAQRRVTDVTNELLKKNAEKLKIATTETARQSERGIVDMDTLKATNESLISTLDEVMAIQREGREKRKAAGGGTSQYGAGIKRKAFAASRIMFGIRSVDARLGWYFRNEYLERRFRLTFCRILGKITDANRRGRRE